MPKGPFHIRTVLNPGGTLSYEVSGMLLGVQQRKRFKTREAAVAHQRELELRMAKSPLQEPRLTWLTHAQVSEAEAALTLLSQKYPSGAYGNLTAAQYFTAHFWLPVSDHTLATAKELYYPAKEKEKIGKSQLRSIKTTMNRISGDLPDLKLHELDRRIIEKWMEDNFSHRENKTWNNNRGIILTFFNWCLDETRRWIPTNPVKNIPEKELTIKVAQIVKVDTARQIMAEVEEIEDGKFALIFALMMFAGIRPGREDGEMLRIAEQLANGHPSNDFYIDENQIFLGANIAKNKQPRWIDLPENLKAWLKSYPPNLSNFCFDSIEDHHARLRIKYAIPHDGPRHSFCSFDAKIHGPGHAAMAAGHTEDMQRKRYRNGSISREDADEYFLIKPTRTPLRNAP